jgi:hypothetical protein
VTEYRYSKAYKYDRSARSSVMTYQQKFCLRVQPLMGEPTQFAWVRFAVTQGISTPRNIAAKREMLDVSTTLKELVRGPTA